MTIISVIISLVFASSCQREPLDWDVAETGASKPVEIIFYTHVGEDPLTKAHSIQEDNILRIVPEEPQGEFGILRERKTGERNALLYKSSVDFEDIEVAPTKATASEVVSVSSFNLVCVTGSAGNESQQWSLSNTGASTGKYWPTSDPGYKFYASNAPLTFNSAGCTVAATNTTDVVVCYKESPTYNSSNSLGFTHIFGRIGNVTVQADEGFSSSDITEVSISITPKTGGTYNIRTDEWSSVTTGSATSIADSTPGTKDNGLYLVPGEYTISGTWNCKGNAYDGSGTVTVTAGQQLNVTLTLGGNAIIVIDVYTENTSMAPPMTWSVSSVPEISSLAYVTYYSSCIVSGTARITDGNNVSTYSTSTTLSNALKVLGAENVYMSYTVRAFLCDNINGRAISNNTFNEKESGFYMSNIPSYATNFGFYATVDFPSGSIFMVDANLWLSVTGITFGSGNSSGDVQEVSSGILKVHPIDQDYPGQWFCRK